MTKREVGLMKTSNAVDFLRQEDRNLCSTSTFLNPGPRNISQVEQWASLGIGAGLLFAGLTRGKWSGLLTSLMGGALLHRGITGHCYAYGQFGIDTAEHHPSTAVPAQQGIKLEKAISIGRPAEELFRFWRNFENLPRIMRHLQKVEMQGNDRSHWVAEGVAGKCVEWDAEIINERENELIAWRSLPGGDIETAGSVHFKSLADGRGTTVVVSMKYNPPGGKLVANLAKFFGVGAEQQIAEDLRRFKQLMEAGGIAVGSQL
jgi:uncharacterized membrane protein